MAHGPGVLNDALKEARRLSDHHEGMLRRSEELFLQSVALVDMLQSISEVPTSPRQPEEQSASQMHDTKTSKGSTASPTPLPKNPALSPQNSEAKVIKALVRQESEIRDYFNGLPRGSYVRKLRELALRLRDHPEPERSGRLSEFIKSRLFETACTMVIIFNVTVASIAADYEMKTATQLGWVQDLELVFVVFYSIELMLKLAVHRHWFFANDEAGWNNFDMVLVVLGIYDVLMDQLKLGAGANLTFVRMGRLLKLSKLFRVFRALRFPSALRLMLASIAQSMAMLFWAMVMLMLLWWTLSLILLQGLSAVMGELDAAKQDTVMLRFGSLPSAMFTLFSISTGGTDWEPIYKLILVAGDFYGFILLFYICFFTISLFNILTGIVVEHVAVNAQVDEEDRVMRFKLKKIEQSHELKKLFARIDKDQSGRVTMEEFLLAMQDHEVLALMEESEVDPRDAAMFYHVLHLASDDQGVDMDHFIDGCMQMRGTATGIDVQILKFQAANNLTKVQELTKRITEVRDLVLRKLTVSKCSEQPERSHAASELAHC